MTVRANSLTERAKTPGDAGQRWSMTAHDGRAFLNAFAALGYRIDSLAAAAGLRESDLSDPDARIPCETLGAVVYCAQRERFTPNLAFEMARVTPMGAYPLLDYLVGTADTVGKGARQLARYCRLVGNPVRIELHEEAGAVRVELNAAAAPFSVEFMASLIILHFRRETEGRFAAASVSFTHRPDDPAALARALGCPVHAAAAWSGVTVPADAWRLPLRRRDPVLRQLLETQAGEILARLPARTGVALDVQRALTQCTGDTGIRAIAHRLAVSPRTLQRRLAAEGISYQELREGERKEAAARYMSEPALAVGEVAYLVGYSEPAPFHRAFKRWYGVTPEEFRQARREARRAGV